MKTKKLQKKPHNFVNNQNYILGKFEKKKVLSKFFLKKNSFILLNILNKISIFLNNNSNKIISISLLSLIFFTSIKYWNWLWNSYPMLLIPLFCSIIPLFIKVQYINTKISSIYEYLINNDVENSLWNQYIFQKMINIFLLFLTFFFIIWKFIWKFDTFLIFYLAFFIQVIIPIWILLIFKKIVLWLKIFNILLIPFILIYQIFYSFYSFINIFIIKWTKWNKIIKKNPNNNLLEDFIINNENIKSINNPIDNEINYKKIIRI